jgi:cytochrome c2
MWLFTLPMLALLAELVGGCERVYQPELLATAATTRDVPTVADTTGDAERGRGLFALYGCTACHTIPGVDGADGLIGPPLAKMAHRGYVAGVVKNTPYNLVRWIKDPPAVDPQTAMPNLRVTDKDARDMGAYLYNLK